MNHLLRELAPFSEEVWGMLDDEARTRLTPKLGARRLVDFSGPMGWEFSAATLGRVAMMDGPEAGVRARQRRVAPVVELRVEFSLEREELESAQRGAVDADFQPLDEAAGRIAAAENAAILEGWTAAEFAGVVSASPYPAIARGTDPADLPEKVAAAVEVLANGGVGGPYALAADPAVWVEVMGGTDSTGARISRHVEAVLGGPIVRVPGFSGAAVVSVRGGDYLFDVGQDLSLGYLEHDARTVTLYLEESFAFRVATAEAAVAIR